MVVIWGLFMLVGGLAGALGAMFERWLIEYPAIPMVLTGLGLYLVALWSITGSGEWGRLAQTLLLTGYAMHLMARWVNLHALALALRSSS